MTIAGFMLLRPIFQLAEQYAGGVTMAFSGIVFCWTLYLIARGRARFSRFELIFFLYFIIAIPVSLIYDASISSVISNFNKLFLCFFCLKAFSQPGPWFKSVGWYRVFQVITYACSGYVIVSLALPSSYAIEWGAKTFEMAFSHQHLAATFIIALISNVYFDMDETRRSFWTAKFLLASILMYALLMTGARTFTFCGAMLYVFILSRYLRVVDRRIRPMVFFVVAAVVGAYVFQHAGDFTFFQKNDNLSTESFTNGRDDIWGYYGKTFLESNLIEQLFGQGVAFLENSSLGIGTHNDVLFFAISFGVIGLVLYFVFVVFEILKPGLNLATLAAVASFVFCALMNGFSGYTDYIVALAAFVASYSGVSCMSGTYSVGSQIRAEKWEAR